MKTTFSIILFFLFSILSLFGQDWRFQQKVVANDRGANDAFSSAVDVSEQYLVMGAIDDGHDAMNQHFIPKAGAAYIFEKDQHGAWRQAQKIVANDRVRQDNFGCAIAVAGNYLVVGARRQAYNATGAAYMEAAGAAYIFERDATGAWQQVQKIVAADRETADLFGYSVAIDGDRVVVGAYRQDYTINGVDRIRNVGAAYVYQRDANGYWQEIQKLHALDQAVGAKFGNAVSIAGEYILVGAPNENNNAPGQVNLVDAGAAYLFKKQANNQWQEIQKLTASDMDNRNYFGTSVAIDEQSIVIGAFNKNHTSPFALDGSGGAYIFEKQESGNWEEVQVLESTESSTGAFFGASLDISGENVIIGAGHDTYDQWGANPVNNAGSAYIYQRNLDGVWEKTKKITASARNQEDYFGEVVAISGNTIICSAAFEDEDRNEEHTFLGSGSAYIYQFGNTY